MRRVILVLAVLASALAWAGAAGAAERYRLDKPHTQILFAVSHLGLSTSYGKFMDYDGGFTLDRGNLSRSKVDVTVHMASVDMGDRAWDDAVKGRDFFDVAQYPDMRFVSTGVRRTGDNAAVVTGNLTLRGVTRPVTLDVTLNKTGRHPFMDKYMAGFSAAGVLRRSDFGMGHGVPFVGDEVKLILEVEGERVDQPGQGTYNQ